MEKSAVLHLRPDRWRLLRRLDSVRAIPSTNRGVQVGIGEVGDARCFHGESGQYLYLLSAIEPDASGVVGVDRVLC